MQEINGITLYTADEVAMLTNRSRSAVRGLANRHKLGIRLGDTPKSQKVFTQADIDVIGKIDKRRYRKKKQKTDDQPNA